MQSPYRRQTRAIVLANVPSPLRAGLDAHGERNQFDLADVRCWLTRTENPPGTGLLARLRGRRANPADPDPVSDTVLVLHATRVLVGTHGERSGTSVLSAPYHDLELVRGYGLRSGEGAGEGITLTGFPSPSGAPASLFVGLEPSSDGRAAEEALTAAIAEAKRS